MSIKEGDVVALKHAEEIMTVGYIRTVDDGSGRQYATVYRFSGGSLRTEEIALVSLESLEPTL